MKWKRYCLHIGEMLDGLVRKDLQVLGGYFVPPKTKCPVVTMFRFRLLFSSVSKVTTFQDCLGVIFVKLRGQDSCLSCCAFTLHTWDITRT